MFDYTQTSHVHPCPKYANSESKLESILFWVSCQKCLGSTDRQTHKQHEYIEPTATTMVEA